MIFEYWENAAGSEGSFFRDDTPQRALFTQDVWGQPMDHLYLVRAATYNEAMAAHYACQGWGPYVPMADT